MKGFINWKTIISSQKNLYIIVSLITKLLFPAENLCIKEVNNSLELKITDFGSAKLPYDDITFNGWTPEYMAPECSQYFLQMMHGVTFGLRQEDITGKVDVFALFLVIGFMYGKKHVLLSLITHGRGNYHGMTAEQKKGLQTELIVMVCLSRSWKEMSSVFLFFIASLGCPQQWFLAALEI